MAAIGGAGDEGLRCHKITAGGMWRCNLTVVRGELLCEKHILRARTDEVKQILSGEIDCGVEMSNLENRSKNSALDIEEAKIMQSSLRKRGRPKGSKNKVKDKEIIVQNEATTTCRKRGRPKGSKNKVKTEVLIEKDVEITRITCEGLPDSSYDAEITRCKRGRPKGSKNKVKTEVPIDKNAGITCTKSGICVRKRGRPKGSKNKQKHEVEEETPVKKKVRQSKDMKKIKGSAVDVEKSLELVCFAGKDNNDNAFVNERGLVPLSFDHQSLKENTYYVDQRSAAGAIVIRGNSGPRKPKCSKVKTKARAKASGFDGEINKVVKMNAIAVKKNKPVIGRTQFSVNCRVKDPGKKKTTSDVNVKKQKRKLTCHQCRKHCKFEVIICSKCNTRQYCYDCVAEWYPGRTKEEFEHSCPFCCGNCNCEACLQDDVIMKSFQGEVTDSNRIELHLYMLEYALPLLRKMQLKQETEFDIESKIRGIRIDEENVQEAYFEDDDRVYCNNCKTSIFNLHRSCPNSQCSYDICIGCCNELRNGIRPGGLDATSTIKHVDWEANKDGSIPCPHESLGGCGTQNLELRHFHHAAGLKLLIKKAEKLTSKDQLSLDLSSSQDSAGFSDMRQAASRKCNKDNFLYCPIATDLDDAEFMHFQMHWKRGEPVIVRNAIAMASGLSWEPNVMLKAFKAVARKLSNDAFTVKAIDCMDWCEREISVDEFFEGYSNVPRHRNRQRSILKLRDWPPSDSFDECLPRHSAEFMAMLPFNHYTNSKYGLLNLATMLPEGASKPDLGPKIYIAYGRPEDPGQGESVTKLHCDVSDAVNILTHAVNETIGNEETSLVFENGAAIWDIFRRQDVPKLSEYLLKHHEEFRHFKNLPLNQVLHTIHDQTFYLDDMHKRQLKDEFDIEPWTFGQQLGEAVFIPAGCPHQVKNIKSCTKVAMDFVSPESIEECFRLTQEFRLLPQGHASKQDILEVKKLVISAVRIAGSEIGKSNVQEV